MRYQIEDNQTHFDKELFKLKLSFCSVNLNRLENCSNSADYLRMHNRNFCIRNNEEFITMFHDVAFETNKLSALWYGTSLSLIVYGT